MIRKVLTYPDPVLKKASKDVEVFDSKLHLLLDDMYETMIAENGIGLAAIQIGVDLSVLIINIPQEEDGVQIKENLIEAINPQIIKKEGTTVYKEGCLSIPEYYEEVNRAEKIEIVFKDRFGNDKSISTDSLLAIAFQHEMDHLKGMLFVERLPMLKRRKFEKEWKKKSRENKKF